MSSPIKGSDKDGTEGKVVVSDSANSYVRLSD